MIYIFFGYLFVEVLVSVQVAGILGGLGVFAEIMFSGFVGIMLLLNVKTTMMQSFQAMSNNCITMKEFQELNIFALLGAILLILPGIFSDLIGILMQFSVFTALIVSKFNKNSGECHVKPQGEDNVIDVEIISNDSKLK
ncbi:FxsA family protein [Sulfurovum sp.]|uniref:FxsA family protein n=1 Tax=Sulfurovum sp. TaxID=1969726 RepID=UPI002867E39E|nr:FxsA family protein [Sulfurovum sp.]